MSLGSILSHVAFFLFFFCFYFAPFLGMFCDEFCHEWREGLVVECQHFFATFHAVLAFFVDCVSDGVHFGHELLVEGEKWFFLFIGVESAFEHVVG